MQSDAGLAWGNRQDAASFNLNMICVMHAKKEKKLTQNEQLRMDIESD